jgi:hypothetical protein
MRGDAMSRDPHPLAGKTVTIKSGKFAGEKYRLEDWWQNVSGMSWKVSQGNPAALSYAMRSVLKDNLPIDDEVVYGKIGPYGHLVHVSELGEAIE